MNQIATCGTCGKTEEIKAIEGRLPDLPPNWVTISLSTRPTINRILCPAHAHAVRTVLGV